jgi:hypothetical protein
MTSRSELTLFEHREIIGSSSVRFFSVEILHTYSVADAWKCGISEEKIAVTLKRAQSTVHKVIVTYRDQQQQKTSYPSRKFKKNYTKRQ